MIQKKPKKIICTFCSKGFSDTDAQKICSNCFACTGCEIYSCPHCKEEVVVRPIKSPKTLSKQA